MTVINWQVDPNFNEDLYNAERSRAQPRAARKHPWPARMDPFAAFAAYPTKHLTLSTPLCRTRVDASDMLLQWRCLAMVAVCRTGVAFDGRMPGRLKRPSEDDRANRRGDHGRLYE